MAILASRDGSPPPLDVVLRQAGAVFANRAGHAAAIHYGSAAGELAVCVSAVGVVDRSDLTILALEAPPSQLGALTSRLTGGEVAPGGALDAAGAWWCGAAPGTVMVVCPPGVGRRLVDRLRVHAAHQVSLRVLSLDFAAIGLLGPETGSVLRALGAYGSAGDPREAAPFGRGRVGEAEVWWLLESDRSALLLTDRRQAGQVWQAIESAGRPCGISCVGQEAAGRYALLERTRSRSAPVAG